MQDVRVRLEQQHLPPNDTKTATTASAIAATATTQTTTSAPTSTTSTTKATTTLQSRRPLHLLPPINLSDLSLQQRQFHYHRRQHPHYHQHQHELQQHHHQQQQQQSPQVQQQQQQQQHQLSTQQQEQQQQHHQLPTHLRLHEADDIHQVPPSPSSEEDNSPTEMNSCRRLVDKPPLVKRLTMGIGLLRVAEDSRPLVHGTSSSLNSGSSQTISDGYVNEAICEPEKLISSKFGDSCRQSLTTLEATQRLQEQHNEFGYQKKKYLRETCSANSSPKMFTPSAPLRLDGLSVAEQQDLKGTAWFQAGIPREISLEVLSRQSPGAFLVRQSSTKPGCFALSLRVPPPAPKVAHYLILRTPRGFKIKGFTKEFSSLRALITHHSVMPELLPVPLTLPRPAHLAMTANRNSARANSQFDGDNDFETYGSLNDFRKVMADLNA